MLLTADWVLPVATSPLPGGAVRLEGDVVVEAGPASALRPREGELVREFPGCVILPGLVNAHTHLGLTALAGRTEPNEFAAWLGRLVPLMRELEPDRLAASERLGALACLRAGVTCAGDIAYDARSGEHASEAGLAGVFFREVLGIDPSELAVRLEAATPSSVRVLEGLSPHTAYTSGPALLREAHAMAAERRLPFAIHVAESAAETELMRYGTGPLAGVAGRLADGFEPPRTSPVAYLQRLGVLEDAIAVHCVQLEPGDAATLAASARGVVLCPRSNVFLGNGMPPVMELLDAGALVALGTDSLASNTDLDLLAEARALREAAPALSAETLVRMATLGGARVLGVGSTFGSLERGKQADIAVFRLPGSVADPYEAVLENAGVEAVIAAGEWRVGYED